MANIEIKKHIDVEMIQRKAAELKLKEAIKEKKKEARLAKAFEIYQKAIEDAKNGDIAKYARKSIFTLNESPVYVNDHMTGKMKGIPCIGTNCKFNTRCMLNAADPDKRNICTWCYAESTLEMYEDLCDNVAASMGLLVSDVIPLNMLPIFGNVNCARFEPFGDLETPVQVVNYMNICKKNPRVTFALWTKNPDILEKGLEMAGGKPKNVILILSSQYINTPADATNYPFIDKIFTVWDSREACEKAGMRINCRATVDGNEVDSCVQCGKCYNKSDKNRYINELLKGNKGNKKK